MSWWQILLTLPVAMVALWAAATAVAGVSCRISDGRRRDPIRERAR